MRCSLCMRNGWCRYNGEMCDKYDYSYFIPSPTAIILCILAAVIVVLFGLEVCSAA